MKKLSLLMIGFVLSICVLFAQGPKEGKGKASTPEQKAVNRSAFLTKKLGLTSEQKQSVYDLILERVTKADAVKAKYTSADKKGMHKELRPILDDFNTKIKAVLTPEQVTKWEAIKSERKSKRKSKDEIPSDGLDD